MSDEPWDKMTGAELASILALPKHGDALQKALDAAREQDPDAQAAAVLQALGEDPAFQIEDDFTKTKSSRFEVLREELQRAKYEEDD